jgi:phosphoenolpyruvate synthase/pyruvate phosphate dikinase
LKQQNLISHVQLKARARGTPNLDLSDLAGGFENELLREFKEGDFIRMKLGGDGRILLEKSTEAAAEEFLKRRVTVKVTLKSDLTATKIYPHAEIGWQDYIRVGSKAANYAELARALNTPERTVVRPGYAIPFFFYQQFLEMNPAIQSAINKALRDPMMRKATRAEYRDRKLEGIRNMILAEDAVISPDLIDKLIQVFDQEIGPDGLKRNMKLRSSTNSEDLPNFNGAGLYDSESYKPTKDGAEKPREKKEKSLRKALQVVWASTWTLRAFDERSYFQIPHADVKMGIEVNPSFGKEKVDGVVVTKNVPAVDGPSGKAVYIEAQRGDKYNATKPEDGTRPEQILVFVDEANPLNQDAYEIKILQKSNVADDLETVLPHDNPNPIMSDAEIKDLVYQSLRGEAHFRGIFGRDDPDFALDLEFKVDDKETGARQVYLKQARPYID